MITAEDIRGRTFEKAVFGGYDMAAVDGFLQEAANDVALLQKENATLRGKMKVLVEKIEEYRSNEDTLRMAVLSAQKFGSSIEQEARQKADTLLADARREASEIVGGADAAAEAEKLRLEEARRSSAKFLDGMEQICRQQLAYLDRLRELDIVKSIRSDSTAAPAQPVRAPAPAQPVRAAAPATAPAPEMHETVRSIEESVARVMDEPQVNVRPSVRPAAAPEDDERPTRSYNIITDPDEDVSRAVLFSTDGK